MGLQTILNKVSSTVQKGYDAVSGTVVLSLAKTWIAVGMVRPATTDGTPMFEKPAWLKSKSPAALKSTEGSTPTVDRYNYDGLYSVQIGDYFMPLSQTFRLRAKKRLNVSHLVDGIDIIQQTRKEAKTIDCTLRLTLRDNQDNLKIMKASNKVAELSQFLTDFYESDAVFEINNDTINNTFGVTHVMITEYDFQPKAASMTYTFNFTLTEVNYGENVLTFDLTEVNSDRPASQTITG